MVYLLPKKPAKIPNLPQKLPLEGQKHQYNAIHVLIVIRLVINYVAIKDKFNVIFENVVFNLQETLRDNILNYSATPMEII